MVRALLTTHLDEPPTVRESLHATLRLRIMEYVRTHLGESTLTAAQVAAAHSISVRQLYRTLDADGISLGSWIRHQRLEGCRKELGGPAAQVHSHRIHRRQMGVRGCVQLRPQLSRAVRPVTARLARSAPSLVQLTRRRERSDRLIATRHHVPSCLRVLPNDFGRSDGPVNAHKVRSSQALPQRGRLVMLIGRAPELSVLEQLLVSIAGGLSAALVLRGEAGAGKTALLDHVADHADEVTITRLSGLESEAHLGFAAIHRLLVPHLAAVDDLPSRRRRRFGRPSDCPTHRRPPRSSWDCPY